MQIMITEATTGPEGKLADAEIHFGPEDGTLLSGLRLIGFAVWRRRTGGYNVTFPARSYIVSGERRSFALLRPMDMTTTSQHTALRDAIVEAYQADAGIADIDTTPTTTPSSPWAQGF
jgi:hypothetical protein